MTDPSRSPAQAICVLGMHRSGTSLLARIIDLLGASLGPPEHLTPANAANPRGFWENFRLVDLNTRLLAHHGGGWNDPPLLLEGWESHSDLDPLRQETVRIIDEEFGTRPLWGWKDPQTCLTLPFWQSVIPSMRYVICIRNPLDVTLSLQERDNMEPQQAARLWHVYVDSLIRHSEGRDRLLVFHQDLLRDWREWIVRLGDFVGRPENARNPYVVEAIGAEIDPGLVHHRSSPERILGLPECFTPAKALYSSLRLQTNHL